MKRICLILSLVLISCFSSQAFTLSKDAEISILTCSPGSELYSLFGHTAIRIHDPAQNYDQVFNYGTFDFQTPHFYLKYARGLLPYQLTHTSFERFLYNYYMDRRSVYSQTLQLDSLQKQRLCNLILENYRPENRSYLYNFLFDNCTTRSRDIVLGSTDSEVAWNIPDRDKSFWDLLDEYLQPSPWVQWGIHTILGQRGNREATTFQYMFLPDYLMYGLETATMDGRSLAAATETLYAAPKTSIPVPWYRTPACVFITVFLLMAVMLWKCSSRFCTGSITLVFFLFSGITGMLIVFLGGFTAHPITAPNWNILWANPLNVIVIPFLMKKGLNPWTAIYLKAYSLILILSIPLWFVLQPAVPMASLAIILLMLCICRKQLGKRHIHRTVYQQINKIHA